MEEYLKICIEFIQYVSLQWNKSKTDKQTKKPTKTRHDSNVDVIKMLKKMSIELYWKTLNIETSLITSKVNKRTTDSWLEEKNILKCLKHKGSFSH